MLNATASVSELTFLSMEEIYEEQISVSVYGNESASTDVYSSWLFKIARWVTYIGLALIPLWFMPFTNSLLELDKKALLIFIAGISLILYLVDMVRSGKAWFKSSPWYIPLFAFLGTTLVTTIFSVLPDNSIFGIGSSQYATLMNWIAYVVLFFILLVVTSDMGVRLHQILVTSLSLTILVGMLQLLEVPLFVGELGQNAFNTIGAPTSFAIFAAFIFPLFLAPTNYDNKWFSKVSTIARWVGALSAMIVFIGINRFAVWAVVFIGLLAYLGFSAIAHTNRYTLRFFAVPLAVIVIGIFLQLISFDGRSITVDRPAEVALDHPTSYGITFDALEARPIGYGPEAFFVAYDQFKPKSIANTIFYESRFSEGRSAVATLITEGGVLMVLSIVLFIIMIVRQLINTVRQRMYGSYLLAATWSSIIGFLLLLFLAPISTTYLVVLMALLALLSLLRHDPADRVINLESGSKYAFIGSVAFVVGLVLVLVGGYFTVNQVRSDIALANALKAETPSESIEHLVTSTNAQSYNANIQRLLSQAIIAKVGQDIQNGLQGDETEEEFRQRINNQIDSATRISIRTTEEQPADSENWMNRGLIYQNLLNLRIEGSGRFAISMYEEALKRSPANPVAYFRIGRTYLTMASQLVSDGVPVTNSEVSGYLDSAQENLQKAIDLYQDYGPAIRSLVALHENKGEVPEAITLVEQLVRKSPQDASLLLELGLLYYQDDRKDEAVAILEQAVRLFPNYSNARWYLSLIYEERADLEAALVQVEAIEEFNPDNELVQQRKEQLKAGLQLIPDETGDVLEQEPLN